MSLKVLFDILFLLYFHGQAKRSEILDDSSKSSLLIGEAPPKLIEARQYGKTVLECSASGTPAPEITWYKDGKPLIKEVQYFC